MVGMKGGRRNEKKIVLLVALMFVWMLLLELDAVNADDCSICCDQCTEICSIQECVIQME
jgi:hypothetical protein